jgi:hypothetical protein
MESHCQIRTKQVDFRSQLDSLKASYELRLMESEEVLLTEQIKCREVVKARCEPLEIELKALKTGDHASKQ